jgi:hypothetical protein
MQSQWRFIKSLQRISNGFNEKEHEVIVCLTAPAFLVYAEDVQTLRAVSGLRSDAGRRFLVSGRFMPECPANREAWAALKGRNNTRVFCLPENVQTLRRRTMSQLYENPFDLLNACKDRLAFLCDVFSQPKQHVPEFGSDGISGLYWILHDVEADILYSINKIKEG